MNKKSIIARAYHEGLNPYVGNHAHFENILMALQHSEAVADGRKFIFHSTEFFISYTKFLKFLLLLTLNVSYHSIHKHNMSAVEQKKDVEQQQEIHKIRITLTSTQVKKLELVSQSIVASAARENLFKKGPVRMPTKTLSIATRKTPNGEGSKTWEHYEMRIHKRYIDLHAPASLVKKITQITIQPGVDVEVTIAA